MGAQRRKRGESQHTGSYLCPDLLLWPPFCPALAPTVHPNHLGEALKVPSHMAFFARFSSGLAFYTLFLFAG